MRYTDGTEARRGDLVAYDGNEAVVVADADTLFCVPEHAEAFFEFYAGSLGHLTATSPNGTPPGVTGGLVATTGVGLVAFFRPEPDITLVRRAAETTGVRVVVEARRERLGFRLEGGD